MAPPASAPPGGGGSGAELAIEGKTVKAVTLLSLKRTHDLFVGNHGQKVPLDQAAQKAKLACKVRKQPGVQGTASSGGLPGMICIGQHVPAQPVQAAEVAWCHFPCADE